jgi:hypothetical protein
MTVMMVVMMVAAAWRAGCQGAGYGRCWWMGQAVMLWHGPASAGSLHLRE